MKGQITVHSLPQIPAALVSGKGISGRYEFEISETQDLSL